VLGADGDDLVEAVKRNAVLVAILVGTVDLNSQEKEVNLLKRQLPKKKLKRGCDYKIHV